MRRGPYVIRLPGCVKNLIRRMPDLISLVNGNHVANNFQEKLVYVYFVS